MNFIDEYDGEVDLVKIVRRLPEKLHVMPIYA